MRRPVSALTTALVAGAALAGTPSPAASQGGAGAADQAYPAAVPQYGGAPYPQYPYRAASPYAGPDPYPYAQYPRYPARPPGPYAPGVQSLEQAIAAQEQRIAEQERRVNEQARLLERQGAQLDRQSRERGAQLRLLIQQQEALERQQRELQALRARQYYAWYGVPPPGAPGVPGAWQGGWWYAGDVQPRAPTPLPPEERPPSEQPPTPDGVEDRVEGEEAPTGQEARPESEKPTELLLLERGGILLPQGRVVVEPSIDYTHSSSDRVAISGFTIFDAIVIGQIRVDDLRRDIITGALTTRVGVTDRIQLENRIPYIYRKDDELLGVGTNDEREHSIRGDGIGDIEATASWQPITGTGSIPDTILRMRVRFPTGQSPFEIERETIGPGGETRLVEAPTGSGFYGVGPGVTMVWRTDPVVLFTGGSYTFNLAREFSDFGRIDPGDTYEWFGGFNLALNETVSINMSFVDQITMSTTVDDAEAAGTSTNDARLVFGASVGIAQNVSVLISAGAGVTEDAPDFTFTVSLPITFDIFNLFDGTPG